MITRILEHRAFLVNGYAVALALLWSRTQGWLA